jgi:hypothetical protein
MAEAQALLHPAGGERPPSPPARTAGPTRRPRRTSAPRSARRCATCAAPHRLAMSPLATAGGSLDERAAEVEALLRDAADRAFGDDPRATSSSATSCCAAYFEPTGSHESNAGDPARQPFDLLPPSARGDGAGHRVRPVAARAAPSAGASGGRDRAVAGRGPSRRARRATAPRSARQREDTAVGRRRVPRTTIVRIVRRRPVLVRRRDQHAHLRVLAQREREGGSAGTAPQAPGGRWTGAVRSAGTVCCVSPPSVRGVRLRRGRIVSVVAAGRAAQAPPARRA